MRVRSGWQRGLRVLVASLTVVGLLTQAAPSVRADDPQAELQKVQQQLEKIRQDKERTKNALANAYYQTEEAQTQLRKVESELAIANSQLAVITNQLLIAETDLVKVEGELDLAKQGFARSKETLAKRIRALNEEGRVNYIAVLLGSATFSDFITRYDMLTMVVRKDSELFDQVRRQKKTLEDRQNEAIVRRNRLADLKAQAELRRQTVTVKLDERQQVTRSLESHKRVLQSQLAEYDRQEELVQELVVEIQRKLARRAGKFAPIAPVRRPYTITSNFGPRLHPILRTWRPHNGTDFAAKTGQPVYAIEAGVVIIAGWNDAYGYLTVIDHGGGVSSWYGHSSRLLVRPNESVTQGQQIALAGSTGWSTGPHVHLEVRMEGKPVDPMEYITD